MSSIVHLESHPKFDGTLQNAAMKIVTLGRAIKRDVSKIISMKSDNTERSAKIIQDCKKRVFSRLEELANIRQNSSEDEKWEDILNQALRRVHVSKRINNIERFTQELEELIGSHRNDVSPHAIFFLQTFMKIIARVPENGLNTTFIPN